MTIIDLVIVAAIAAILNSFVVPMVHPQQWVCRTSVEDVVTTQRCVNESPWLTPAAPRK